MEDLNFDDKIEVPHEVNFTILNIAMPDAAETEGSEEDADEVAEIAAEGNASEAS